MTSDELGDPVCLRCRSRHLGELELRPTRTTTAIEQAIKDLAEVAKREAE